MRRGPANGGDADSNEDGQTRSLSQRERAGVRENGRCNHQSLDHAPLASASTTPRIDTPFPRAHNAVFACSLPCFIGVSSVAKNSATPSRRRAFEREIGGQVQAGGIEFLQQALHDGRGGHAVEAGLVIQNEAVIQHGLRDGLHVLEAHGRTARDQRMAARGDAP